jgi:dTDP-4-dehydrorhamnose reductase
MKERESLGVVADQLGSPTFAADLAGAILNIIKTGDWIAGLYHYSNEGIISWYDFANAIKELSGSKCTINAITTDRFPTPAKRPGYSGLDKEKIKSNFKLNIPYWKDSLQICLEKLMSQNSTS